MKDDNYILDGFTGRVSIRPKIIQIKRRDSVDSHSWVAESTPLLERTKTEAYSFGAIEESIVEESELINRAPWSKPRIIKVAFLLFVCLTAIICLCLIPESNRIPNLIHVQNGLPKKVPVDDIKTDKLVVYLVGQFINIAYKNHRKIQVQIVHNNSNILGSKVVGYVDEYYYPFYDYNDHHGN